MQGLSDRIKEAYEGKSARSIAQISGVPGSTVQSILGGSVPRADNLIALAEGANVDIGWLATGEGTAKRSVGTVALDGSYMSVPRYNAAASAGHGAFVSYAEKLDDIPFTEEFITKRLRRSSAEGLIIVDAAGDSMEPTISDNDLIMIDTHKTQLTAAVYAFTYEDGFFVKRINHLPDALEVRSDNKEYPPFIIKRDQMNMIEVLGRVVWVGHTP